VTNLACKMLLRHYIRFREDGLFGFDREYSC